MSGPIASGGSIEIRLPSSCSPVFEMAGLLLRRELTRRVNVPVEITAGKDVIQREPRDIVLRLETWETLPEDLRDHMDPPLRLAPYPDYAEHVNLRTVETQASAEIFLIAGSESALIFSVGMLLRGLRFESGSFHWESIHENYQPNNPLRGFFIKENTLMDMTDGEWEEWILQTALWGNNWVGVPANAISSDRLAVARKWGVQPGLFLPVDVDVSMEFPLRFLWISPRASRDHALLSPVPLIQRSREIRDSFLDGQALPEVWLDCSEYGEELLAALFDELIMEEDPCVKALVCSSTSDSLAMIQKEMPLTLQLITINSMDLNSPDPLLAAARLYFENAPLTYGALAESPLKGWDDLRLYWSLLSWSPQPPVDGIREFLDRNR